MGREMGEVRKDQKSEFWRFVGSFYCAVSSFHGSRGHKVRVFVLAFALRLMTFFSMFFNWYRNSAQSLLALKRAYGVGVLRFLLVQSALRSGLFCSAIWAAYVGKHLVV
jgi:hypothetical protein